MVDRRNRPLRDLRISVTDRCNLRCRYCMPLEVFGPDFVFLARDELLSFEEIAELAGAFVAEGVQKLRLTGGEPLLRRDLPRLVAMLAGIPGVEDLALTTNGTRLARWAGPLAQAGLGRVTISLDALDDATFGAMNGVGARVAPVLEGIAAAAAAGLGPVKVNMVVKRGVNEHSVLDMAAHFREQGHTLRLIEFMDVGASNRWRLDEVVPAAELRDRIAERWPIEPVPAAYPGEVASRYRYLDGAGEIGFITSVTQPFCGGCTRARLSADGRLYTCLFTGQGHDLRELVRGGASGDPLRAEIARLWGGRSDRYSELRAGHPDPADSGAAEGRPRVEMSYIGG